MRTHDERPVYYGPGFRERWIAAIYIGGNYPLTHVCSSYEPLPKHVKVGDVIHLGMGNSPHAVVQVGYRVQKGHMKFDTSIPLRQENIWWTQLAKKDNWTTLEEMFFPTRVQVFDDEEDESW